MLNVSAVAVMFVVLGGARPFVVVLNNMNDKFEAIVDVVICVAFAGPIVVVVD